MGADGAVPAPAKPKTTTLIFTYGTLKRGFPNHILLHDLITTNNASFLGTYKTTQPFPLVCGPYKVPFLLNFPNQGHPVSGELYAVSETALSRLDDLEGVEKGHYQRLKIEVVSTTEGEKAEAEAYFADTSYADGMWRRCGEIGFDCYSEKVAVGYVKRGDRPGDEVFLDQIRLFVGGRDDNGI